MNVNPYQTSMVLGENEKVLYGDGTIEDTLCGCVFRISAKSFYQINPVQTEILYQKAIAFAGLTGKETVIDAYCGNRAPLARLQQKMRGRSSELR